MFKITSMVRYVEGKSLLRIITPSIPVPTNEVDVTVVLPSLRQEELGCDACRGKHQPKNKRCFVNGRRRQIPAGRILDLKEMKLLPLRYKLLNVAHRARAKVGEGTLSCK